MSAEPQALQIIARFDIPLGVQDKTIEQVCNEHGVDVSTFLTIINYKLGAVQYVDLTAIDATCLLSYLRNAHDYFLSFILPALRRKIIGAMNYSAADQRVAMLIIRSYDEYCEQISMHMQHENEQIFPYVEGLLRGEQNQGVDIADFARHHHSIDDQNAAQKLSEVKNLIIRFCPPQGDTMLINSALYDLFITEQDFATHCAVEDDILFPLVRQLEKRPVKRVTKSTIHTPTEFLSGREKEVLVQLVKGLQNKEIADKLNISVHTVITHRKNISKKLGIHSPAGLTVYAIANHLVELSEL